MPVATGIYYAGVNAAALIIVRREINVFLVNVSQILQFNVTSNAFYNNSSNLNLKKVWGQTPTLPGMFLAMDSTCFPIRWIPRYCSWTSFGLLLREVLDSPILLELYKKDTCGLPHCVPAHSLRFVYLVFYIITKKYGHPILWLHI